MSRKLLCNRSIRNITQGGEAMLVCAHRRTPKEGANSQFLSISLNETLIRWSDIQVYEQFDSWHKSSKGQRSVTTIYTYKDSYHDWFQVHTHHIVSMWIYINNMYMMCPSSIPQSFFLCHSLCDARLPHFFRPCASPSLMGQRWDPTESPKRIPSQTFWGHNSGACGCFNSSSVLCVFFWGPWVILVEFVISHWIHVWYIYLHLA